MSTEVNCMNGGNSEIHHQQQETLIDGVENVLLTTTPAAVKSLVTDETDFFPEIASTNSHSVGTTCSASGSGSGSRSQKSKKRQNQKTFSLMDIFDMHQGIGSWADAAADTHTTSYSPSTAQDTSEVKQIPDAVQRVNASQQDDESPCHNTDRNIRSSSISLDRATHSKNVDLAHLPDRPPFEVKVTNINYKSSDNDLFDFFGGEGSVVNIRSEGQAAKRGTAIVSLSSQEALVNALKLNSMELRGRPLRISLRDHQSRSSFGNGRTSIQDHPSFGFGNMGPNNAHGNYRSSGCHEGGFNTLPHLGGGPPPVPYRSYNSVSRINRLPLQHYSSYRGRDTRDSRQFRHPRSGNNQISRMTNRGSDSYGRSANENRPFHQTVEMEFDADRRGHGRIRMESVRSSAAEGTEKHERRRLQLQPRTKPLNSTEDDLPARPTSIFGLAKPVDTYEKEKQAEERLRLENEAFKAAEQRSRKSSERSVSASVSSLLIHGQVSLVTRPPLNDRENTSPSVQKIITRTSRKSVEGDEKVQTTSVMPLLVTRLVGHEERVAKQTETSVTALASASQFPPPLPEPTISAVRRQSLSNCPEISETRSSAALLRKRNSYRTFTRSRDSVHTQVQPNNRLQNIPVYRGKGGSRRGGAVSKGLGSKKDKHFVANKEEVAEHDSGRSNMERTVANGPKQTQNEPKPEQHSTTEEKHQSTGTNVTTTKQPCQQSDQQCSKREKKKQATTWREMPQYIEPKPFTFSSENKYAALQEADD